jgi:hypothetical protein
MLVGWVRLLSGRPTDPLVGREILLGAVIGVALGFAGVLTDLIAGWLGWPSSGAILPEFLVGGVADLSGPRKLVITALLSFYGSVLWILAYASILLVCRLMIKRDWISSTAAALLICVSLLASVGRFIELPRALPVAAVVSMAVSIAIVLTITRVGLLAALSALAIFKFSYYSPISADITAWYGSHSLFTFAMTFAIAGYGLFVSLAGQPILKCILPVETSVRP